MNNNNEIVELPGSTKFGQRYIANSIRWIMLVAIVFTLFQYAPSKAAGGDYSIIFTAADPRPLNGSFDPTYERVTPDGKACPTPTGGRANNPLVDAVYSDPDAPHAVDAVTSMAPGDMVLGQIVPFEIVVEVNGDTSPENGVIKFVSSWSTETTPGDDFGYDSFYGVYCAFVDTGDAHMIDPGNDAAVDSFSDSLAGADIHGEFQISGLDDNDRIVIEIWMVLDSELPETATGNVASGMVSAETVDLEPETINVGTQTVPLQKVGDFLKATADLSISKVDVPNEPLQPLDIFDYVISVTNTSEDTVSNGVVITDTLDIHTQFLSAEVYDPGAFGRNCVDPLTLNNGDVFCDLKSISSQETVPITITVQILPTVPRSSIIETGDCEYGDHATYDICNQVVLATTITEDENLENNSDTEPKDVISVADIGVIVFCPLSPITIDESVGITSIEAVDALEAEFIVSVINFGPDPSSGVVLTDTYPANTPLIQYQSTHPVTQLESDPLVLSLNDPLAVADTWVITITLDVTSIISNTTVTITNTAEVSAETPQPDGASAPDADFCQVTPVNLNYFLAKPIDGFLEITWETTFETGNHGFNLYGESVLGLQKLNQSLIPSREMGSISPNTYSFKSTPQEFTSIYLETVDAAGRSRMHGPYLLDKAFDIRVKPVKTDWENIWREHEIKSLKPERVPEPMIEYIGEAFSSEEEIVFLPNLGKRANQPIPAPVTFDSIDILVDEEGMYRISYEDLFTAGHDLRGVHTQTIALMNKGTSTPILIFGDKLFSPGSYIEFYGKPVDSQYTHDNVYTLVNQHSLPNLMKIEFSETNSNLPVVPTFTAQKVFNINNAYSMASPDRDPWFETEIRSGETPVMKEISVWIDNYSGDGSSIMELNFWGMTDQPSIIDHHVVVKLNDTEVVNTWFDGIVSKTVEVVVPPGTVHKGSNQLKIILPGDTGVDSQVAVNSYSFTYQSEFLAINDVLKFRSTGERFQAGGFTTQDISVFRISPNSAWISGADANFVGGSYWVDFSGYSVDSTYLVVEKNHFLTPKLIQESRELVDLLDQPADFLIISHPDFLNDIQALVTARTDEGLSVKLVDVYDIYARYSHRIVDPVGIKDYVTDAVQNLGVENVLLVGADTYDYLNYGGSGSFSFIPSLYAPTHIFVRHSPVDSLFGDINDDGSPEIAVGRLPVRTSAETVSMVTKILAYDDKNYAQKALFVSDQDDGTLNFAAQSDNFIQSAANNWQIEKAYLESGTNLAEVRQSIFDNINSGVALVNYIGHSSDQQWSEKGIFTSDDMINLTNLDRPSVFSQWACWNNYISWPETDTLAHALLVQGDVGAAAALGSVTLTGANLHSEFGQLLLEYMMAPGMSLGEAMILAKNEFIQAHPGYSEAMNGFSILGDPTMKVTP